jgi:hypothetical protein
MSDEISELHSGLESGQIIPYLGPGIWAAKAPTHPATALDLVARLTERATVPHKIRKNLTAAAQYIENFKHRKTLAAAMNNAFSASAPPTELHEFLAGHLRLPLIVDAWYDDAMQQALRKAGANWGQVQSVSQAEHHGEWVRYYTADGELTGADAAEKWQTVLYRPLGSVNPAQNYVISDSDYVEILTEIDIQTPIPQIVQERRRGRHFLFLGCRFSYQLDRIFARQVMKRSSDSHWALIEGELTKNEVRFLEEMNIKRLDMPLEALMKQAVPG